MGAFWSVLVQTYPPAPTWSVNDIPDLSGKVVVVTGGNTGIGKETIRALLSHNAKVYMASRSKDKAENVINELKQETGNEAIFLPLDLASLASVRKAAEEFSSKERELHLLFNNGGVLQPPMELVTEDGYDLQFGTNVIGHYFFTKLLLPALFEGAQSSPDKKARVITSSSATHYLGDLYWDTFVDGPARRSLSLSSLYNQSKYGNVVVARELARQYGDQGIVSISVHPGAIKTDLLRHGSDFQRILTNLFLYPVSHGALTQLWAGTAPEAADGNGKYAIPWARIGTPAAGTQNPEIGQKLWTWLEKQVEGR